MVKPIRAEVTDGETRRYRLLLADDHSAVRQAIRQLLASEFEVLNAVADGAALIRAARELQPDVIVSDIQMPGLGGIEAGSTVLGQGLCKAVVMLTMYQDRHLVETALSAGIRGFVLKLDASEELIPAVYAALRGERYLSRGVRAKNQ